MSIQATTAGGAATQARGAVASAPSWLAQRAWQVMATILLQHAIWRAESDLTALSDRTLKDIGLSRGEIKSAVREVLAADDFIGRLSRSA
jgi:uncharacterized protein YjiS (DUF1127 family)